MNHPQSDIDEMQRFTGLSLATRRFQTRPARIHLLHGHSAVFTAGLLIGGSTGLPVAVIDGAMRFNSYALSKVAGYLGTQPKNLLRRTYVTRSFTAFQTEAAITEKLPRFLAVHECPLVVILGLLDTYYDEQVKPNECRRSLQRIMQALRKLSEKNIHFLIADVEVTRPPEGKEGLFRLIKRGVDMVELLEVSENGFQLKEERREQGWAGITTHSRLSWKETKTPGASSAEG